MLPPGLREAAGGAGTVPAGKGLGEGIAELGPRPGGEGQPEPVEAGAPGVTPRVAEWPEGEGGG